MRGAALVACCLASACGRIWFDPLGGDDVGGDAGSGDGAPACMFGPYADPSETPNLNSTSTEFSMSLTGDQLTIVFQTYRAGTGDIYRATRGSVDVDFGAPAVIAELSGAALDGAPSITEDGLEIVFLSNRSGRLDLWRSRRASTAASFPTPTLVFTTPASTDRDGPDISADGLTLYYTYGGLNSGMRLIHRASRPDVTAEFVDEGVIAELDSPADDSLPTVSRDELEIVFESTRDGPNRLYAARRAQRTDPFGMPSPISELLTLGPTISDPELADSDHELYFTLDTAGSRDIWSARRPCD